MPSKKEFRRVKNWRASRRQEFCSERYFRKLEKVFWNYNRIKYAIALRKEENKIYLSASKIDGMHTVGSISDPTQKLAFDFIENLPSVEIENDEHKKETFERPEEWVVVVEQTLARFAKDSPMVKEVLYRRYILNEGSPHTWMDLEINSDKYYKARNVGLQYARECAIQLGLLKAFEPSNVEPLRSIQLRTNY